MRAILFRAIILTVRARQYRVSLGRVLGPDEMAYLLAIPGIGLSLPYSQVDPLPYSMGSTLYVPPDARSIILRMLESAQIQSWWTLVGDPEIRIPRQIEDIPGLRKETLRHLFPAQRAAVPFLDQRNGGYLHWDTGTGKTWESLIFAAADPVKDRRILIVTLPNTTYQIAAAVTKYIEPGVFLPYVLEGERPATVVTPPKTATWTWVSSDPDLDYAATFPRKKGGLTPQQREDPGLLSSSERRKLLEAGSIEEVQPGEERASVRSNRTREILASFSGREPLILPPVILDQMRARAQAKGPKDKEAFTLTRPVTEDPVVTAEVLEIPVEEVLSIRAKALARSMVEGLRDTCDIPPDANMVIMGYPILPARRQMLRRWAPTTLILDEAHRLKSADLYAVEPSVGSDRVVLARNWPGSTFYVAEHVPRILLASATPAPDIVRDWYSQLMILTRGMGKKRQFTDRYCGGQDVQHNEHHAHYDSSGISNGPELEERISYWTYRFSKDDIRGKLPKIMREITRIPPEKLAQVKISHEEWRLARSGGSIGLLELQILIAGAQKRPFTKDRIFEHLAAKPDLKCVVLGGRQVDADLLGRDLINAKFPGDVWVAHGESHPDSKERFDLARKYRAHTGPIVLVGTLDAWGTGVDGLQDTDRLLITHLPWSPGKLDQGEGRVDRPDTMDDLPFYRGAPRELRSSVIEYIWACGTIDDRIGDVFLDKAADIGVTYGELRKRIMELHDALAGGESSEARVAALADRLLNSFPDDYEDP